MGPWYAVRASHVNRPSNNLKILIEFGRSDRRLVDNGSTEGSIKITPSAPTASAVRIRVPKLPGSWSLSKINNKVCLVLSFLFF